MSWVRNWRPLRATNWAVSLTTSRSNAEMDGGSAMNSNSGGGSLGITASWITWDCKKWVWQLHFNTGYWISHKYIYWNRYSPNDNAFYFQALGYDNIIKKLTKLVILRILKLLILMHTCVCTFWGCCCDCCRACCCMTLGTAADGSCPLPSLNSVTLWR